MFHLTRQGDVMQQQDSAMDAASICVTKGIHADIVSYVEDRIPDSDQLNRLAELFKLFGDGTRIGILWALSESEMCVCDICALLHMKQPAVSHQLKNLKQARIVKNRRDGKVIYYSLDDDHIRKLLNLGMEHVKETLN
jgi:ArsR family transcriptional regulator, lead/cadmium/zinc/bismuth-responsive transcriptional repressor